MLAHLATYCPVLNWLANEGFEQLVEQQVVFPQDGVGRKMSNGDVVRRIAAVGGEVQLVCGEHVVVVERIRCLQSICQLKAKTRTVKDGPMLHGPTLEACASCQEVPAAPTRLELALTASRGLSTHVHGCATCQQLSLED